MTILELKIKLISSTNPDEIREIKKEIKKKSSFDRFLISIGAVFTGFMIGNLIMFDNDTWKFFLSVVLVSIVFRNSIR